MEEILIKYHSEHVEKLQKIAIGDWIDLRSVDDIDLRPGDDALVSLGVSMVLPDGYEAHLAPRSSSYKNFGFIVTNSFGIVDNSYRGIWCLPIHALKPVTIRRNDRICQFRIVKNQPEIRFTEVEDVGTTERGSQGYGSTGKD